jgi:hypothetical protein
MNRVGKLALVAGILVIALAVPIATAHLIYVYEAQATLKPVTPIVWLYGNSQEVSAVSLSITNRSNPQISLTIPITNSSETYVYQALELKVNGVGSPNLYVDSCSYTYSGSSSTEYSLKYVEVIVYPTSGSPSSGSIINITGFSPCTATNSVSLTAGTTYYVDFLVVPSLPIPYGAGLATLTIYFGLSNQTPTVTVPAP